MSYLLRAKDGGKETLIPCEAGQTIGEALKIGGIAQVQPCGGRGVCGKCKLIASGGLEPPDLAEEDTLGSAIRQGMRLACRAKIAGDCSVTLQSQGTIQISSGTASLVSGVEPFYQNWGVAVDIGTTTLAAQLYHDGAFQGDAVAANPQSAYGADVMTRIGASLSGQRDALQKSVVCAIETMVEALTSGRGIRPDEIDAMVLTGNTTMLYLLTGRTPETLSHAPFAADCLFGEVLDAKEMGFSFSARCYLPRCIAAFVGADITTAMLASGMLGQSETALLVDIGTNGEMALWHDNQLVCCATAAGPAFEGAEISCGCHGIPGAVDHVWVENGTPSAHTIGEAPPVGICGSGIIDAVAALLRTGAVDETGRLAKPDAERNGESAARVAEAVYLTQRDIRSVQLAKSAICAGIRTLLHEAGLKENDLTAFYIAGGFGSFIDLNSAAEIGLFPAELIGVARVIGNAAETGAAMMLQDCALHATIDGALDRAKAIDLSANSYFMNQYVEGMCF
ncbi:MAG: ASKHA domain-containing protein [Christensenella sp.]|nr:ASKHA domain-containing protein [Christensenella sp.]